MADAATIPRTLSLFSLPTKSCTSYRHVMNFERHAYFRCNYSLNQYVSQFGFHSPVLDKSKSITEGKRMFYSRRNSLQREAMRNSLQQLYGGRSYLKEIRCTIAFSSNWLCHLKCFSPSSYLCINWTSPCKSKRSCRNSLAFMHCRAAINFASIMPLEWNYVVDELLLAATVVLAYLAGVVTYKVPYFQNKQIKIGSKNISSADDYTYKSLVNEDTHGDSSDIWNTVEQKLVEALEAVGVDDKDSSILESQRCKPHYVLNLQAMLKGPRLRLLLNTLLYLRKEVGKIQTDNKNIEPDEHAKALFNVLNGSSEAIYIEWFMAEKCLQESASSQTLNGSVPMPTDFQASDFLVKSMMNTSKQDVYAEFLLFLCFKSTRSTNLSYTLLQNNSIDMLEDMVISLADGIAELYLEILVMDMFASDNNDIINLLRPSFQSTRALERFRNEVALNKWLYTNFYSVSAIYEDRFDIWAFHQVVKESVSVKNQFQWWKVLRPKNSMDKKVKDIQICQRSLQAKRIKELKSLTGWRYYYSIFLEASDIVAPLIREFATKIGNLIAFLLVTLIGRSLGLIYRGIRQSVGWKPQ